MAEETPWSTVDRYVTELFLSPDSVLTETVRASTAAGLPDIGVSPAQGRMLSLLTAATRMRAVLEVGTLGGYSAICLARGLRVGGRLVTLERVPAYAAVARSNIANAGFADTVEVRVGNARDLLSQLVIEEAGPFDLVFIDADKPSYPEYFTLAMRLSRPGTLIVADNVVRDGAVVNPTSTDPNVLGVRQFNSLLAANPLVSATVLQTVGAKGHDGFALIVINPRGEGAH